MNDTNKPGKNKSILATYINTFRGLPPSVWKIIISYFVATILSGTLYFFSYYFVHILNYSIENATFFISCYGIGSILGSLIGGKLADIYSARLVAIVSLVLEGITFLLFLKIKTKLLIMVSMILFGIANYSFITSNYVWVLNNCKSNESQKLKAINMLTVISNLGLGLAAVLLGIFKHLHFKILFICYGCIFLVIACYLFLFTPKNEEQKILKTHKEIANKHTPNIAFVYLMLLSLFLVGTVISQMSSTYSLYIYTQFPQYGLRGFSIIFLINTFLVVTMQAPIGSFLSGKNNIKFVSYGSMCVGIGMAILSFATAFLEVIVACVIYTLGEIVFFSLSLLVCYENSPQEQRGQWTGIYRMTFALSRVVGPLLGGYVYHHYNYKTLWGFCFLIGLSTFLICSSAQFKFKQFVSLKNEM